MLAHFNLGYSQHQLFKKTLQQNHRREALENFKLVLELLNSLQESPKTQKGRLEAKKQRWQVLTLGYMAQLEQGTNRIVALQKWIDALDLAESHLKELQMIRTQWLLSKSKAHLQMAYHLVVKKPEEFKNHIEKSAEFLSRYQKEEDPTIDSEWFNGIKSWILVRSQFSQNESVASIEVATQAMRSSLVGLIKNLEKMIEVNPQVKSLLEEARGNLGKLN